MSLGPVPVAVYAAMLGATIAGQLAGIAVDGLMFGRRVVWIPLALSVVFEAVTGARFGAARLGRSLKPGECARLSAYYSACLGSLSLPLAAWTLASNRWLAGGASPASVGIVLGVAFAGWAVATALRFALMALLSLDRGQS